VHGNRSVLVWFAFVWPAVAALLGGLVVQRVSRPPLDGDPAALGGDPAALGGTAPPGSSAVEQRVELLLRGSRRERQPVYRWFGVLVAWAGWLVPGVVLDWFGSLWPG
jgi:hypothetical protein